ncbi:MAG: TolC family protein [Planctomycetes bacterium]|nr:TolC family protein [Planctomycetota bacterium]
MQLRLLAAATALFTILPACRSTSEWRAESDREAYALVESRRARLGIEDGPFTIEAEASALRADIEGGRVTLDEPQTLVQVLEIAASNSREFQRQKERLYVAALDLTLERWRFAIQKGGTLNALVGGTGDEAETASAGGGFSLAKVLGTGATIVGSLGLNLTRSLISSDGWHPQSDVSLSITQPLMAGFGERIVKEPLTQAERDLVYQVRAFERFRRTFAFDVASRYYRLLQLEDSVKNQENNVTNLEQLSERNRALAEAGRLSDIELGQARQTELRSQNDLLTARQRLSDSRDQFKLFLGLPITSEVPLDPSALAALESDQDAGIDFDEDAATRFALQNRLDHQTVLDRIDDADRRVLVAEDNLRSILTLDADARLASADGKPLKFDASDATWSVGATLSLPFERLPQRNSYRAAIIARAESGRAAVESEDQIRTDLRGDLRAAANRRDSYVIQKSAVDLAERRIESTRLKLDAGRADTRDLLEAQDSLLQAQNAVTSARIEYTLSRLNLFLDMELLTVDSNGIRLESQRLQEFATEAMAPEDGS